MTDDILQLPIINLNGTSKDELLRQVVEAINALRIAHSAMCAANPHGRDYQTVPGAYEIAREQHAARVSCIEVLTKHMSIIAKGIRDQEGR